MGFVPARESFTSSSGRVIKGEMVRERGLLGRKNLSMIEYKVTELAVVTDESIEEVLNCWTAQGWHFDSIQFVMRDASKRPAMAFVLFTRAAVSG
jgi:hypothetical protein